MWVKLDDGLLDHPKILRAGASSKREGRATAIGIFAVGLLYTNRHLTDGFLPLAAIGSLFDKPVAAVALMTDAGLWRKVEGGYQIHDYADHNPRAADVLEHRQAERDRKRKWRANNRNGDHP